MNKFNISNEMPGVKPLTEENKTIKPEIRFDFPSEAFMEGAQKSINDIFTKKYNNEIAEKLDILIDLQKERMEENKKTQENTERTNQLLYALLVKPSPTFPELPQFPKTISISNFPKMEKTEFPVWEITNSLKKLYESQSETNDLLRELLQKEETETKEEKDDKGAGGVPSTIGVRRVMGKVIKVETPVGTINGTNTIFRLSRAPFNGFLLLNLGGTWQVSGYTLSGNTITYSVAPQLNPDNTIPDHKAVFF